jgi:uncharacterized membrane protein YkoI
MLYPIKRSLTAITQHGAVAVMLLLALTAFAKEKHITKSDLPAPVQKAAEEQAQGAKVLGYSTETENGQREYEIEMMVNGHSRDVTFSPDGNVLESEEQVDPEALPPAVRDSLQAKAASGKITKVESLTKAGKVVAYEAQVHKAAKKYEVQVGPDGKPLAHPE